VDFIGDNHSWLEVNLLISESGMQPVTTLAYTLFIDGWDMSYVIRAASSCKLCCFSSIFLGGTRYCILFACFVFHCFFPVIKFLI